MSVTETSSSGDVVRESLSLGAAVRADPSVSDCVGQLLTARAALKRAMRDRQDAEDEVLLEHGVVIGSEVATDAHVLAYAEKLAGHLARPNKPGTASPLFIRLFDQRTPATLLPDARAERTEALHQFKVRIADEATPADVRKLAADFLKAIDHELAMLRREAEAKAAFEKAEMRETEAKLKTVVEFRACTNLVKSKLAESPGRARRLLGFANPGNRRSKADEAKRKVAEAKRLAELAKKAADAAAKAQGEAEQATLEAEAEAQAKAAKEAKKKKGKSGELTP